MPKLMLARLEKHVFLGSRSPGLSASGAPFSHDVAAETRMYKQRRAPLPHVGSEAGRARSPKENNRIS